MPRPLVIAYHLIWTAYGCWLPNDPRGSGSRAVFSDAIAPLGKLHHGRRQIQPASEEVSVFYEKASKVLKYPPLKLSSRSIDVVAQGLLATVTEQRYTCYAGAIMPDHVHLLVRKHKHSAEEMLDRLQSASRDKLRQSLTQYEDHPVWTRGGWKVFLDHPNEIRRVICYIEKNPEGARLPRQNWSFVKAYDGWPLHPGHNANSPYARRLRDYHD